MCILGQPVILCFAHRINNVLKTCFYQTAQKKEKRIILASTTPTTKKGKTSKIIIQSSSDYTSSDEETKAPSPSKYIELNTSLSELAPKTNEFTQTLPQQAKN